MKMKILLAFAIAMLMTGCGDLLGPDKEGWKASQKSDFVEILKKDTYMSVCNQQSLANKVIADKNLLVVKGAIPGPKGSIVTIEK
jgi:uncharacterized protein YceK